MVDEWKALVDNWQRKYQSDEKMKAGVKAQNAMEYKHELDYMKG